MIEQNEIIMLFLGIGVLVFIQFNMANLRHVPSFKMLLGSFGIMVAGFAFTVLEGVFLGRALNVLEHSCYLASALLLLAWCWLVFIRKGKSRL